MKIWQIDDDHISNFLAERVFEKTNSKGSFKTFLSAEDAYRELHDNVDNEEKWPDIMLLDINMPVMNGWDFLKAIEEMGPKYYQRITIYILTSSIYLDDIEKGHSNPLVKEYLVKPITIDTLERITNPEKTEKEA